MSSYYGSKILLLFVVNIAFYLQNLLFLPLFSRTLGIEMYGVWTQVSVAMSLLTPVVLLALPQSFTRFSAGEADAEQVAKNYYTALLCVSISGLTFYLLLYASSGFISRAFADESSDVTNLFKVSGLLLIARVLSLYSINYFSTFQRSRIFGFFRILHPCSTICSAVAVVMLGFGLCEVILAFAVTNFAIYATAQFLICREVGLRLPDLKLQSPSCSSAFRWCPQGR